MSRDARAPVRTAATRPAGRVGRPPLTEVRKAEIRLEIARQAVRLFSVSGVAATTAEEIAAAAGISVRTLWRYFPTKESCILPLLTGGIEIAAHWLRAWPPGRGAAELLDDLERRGADDAGDIPTMLNLVRLTRTEPALRAAWLQAHDEAEPIFAAVLAQRAGLPGGDLTTRVQAAMINSALRAAAEHYAFHTDPAEPDDAGLLRAIRLALLTATRGFEQ